MYYTLYHISTKALSGENVTVFAYGATSAGKTHTMYGSSRADEASLHAEAGSYVYIYVYLHMHTYICILYIYIYIYERYIYICI
jgi:hypothetical protein